MLKLWSRLLPSTDCYSFCASNGLADPDNQRIQRHQQVFGEDSDGVESFS